MIDDAQRVERQLSRLPIFPLPGAVLLPYALIPLHVFEPRYRQMVRDCQAGSGVLALANVPPEALRERRQPPLRGIADGPVNVIPEAARRADEGRDRRGTEDDAAGRAPGALQQKEEQRRGEKRQADVLLGEQRQGAGRAECEGIGARLASGRR